MFVKLWTFQLKKYQLVVKLKKLQKPKYLILLWSDEAREIINKLYQEFNKKIQIGGTGEEDVKKVKTGEDDTDEDEDDTDEDEDDTDEDDDEGKRVI